MDLGECGLLVTSPRDVVLWGIAIAMLTLHKILFASFSSAVFNYCNFILQSLLVKVCKNFKSIKLIFMPDIPLPTCKLLKK